MSRESAFQTLCKDIGDLAMYIVTHNERIPRPDSPLFVSALKEATFQYLAIMLQTSPDFKKTIYGYVQDYYPLAIESPLRQFYRHEKTIRTRADNDPNGNRHLYDPSDFIAIQKRVDRCSLLEEAVLRKNIHLAKNISDSTFAKMYAEYNQEYQTAACLADDNEYVFTSIYFYRLEYALALSLIANIAEYMAQHQLKNFDFEKAAPFLTDVMVPDVDLPENRSFCAWPNLLSVSENIPYIFSDDTLPSPLSESLGSRILKQNILERLPHPEQYGKFDLSEIAAFIRTSTPIIESHTPVSFYLDKATKTLDRSKIKLARMLMRQFYSLPTEKPSAQ